MNKVLKPCPFCGGEDEATVRIITLAKDMYRVEEDNDD